MIEIQTLSELKKLLETNEIKKIYIQIVEEVEGYYQLKNSIETNLTPLTGQDWFELEGSPTEAGKYISDKPVFEGRYTITTEHEVDVIWFKEKLNGYIEWINSDFLGDELDEYITFCFRFGEYGAESGEFEINSEMGLNYVGMDWSTFKKTRNIILSTYGNQNNIETGLIYGSDGEEINWRFE
jgi:hypothetical protein